MIGKVKPTTKFASHRQKVAIPIPRLRRLWGKISDKSTQVVGETLDWKKAKKHTVAAITKYGSNAVWRKNNIARVITAIDPAVPQIPATSIDRR